MLMNEDVVVSSLTSFMSITVDVPYSERDAENSATSTNYILEFSRVL